MRQIRSVLALSAATAVALSLTTLAPASGKVVFKEHFEFTDSHVEQEEHGDEFCPNVDFPTQYDVTVRGLTIWKTKGGSPFPYFGENFKVHETFTNLDNGKTFQLLTVGRNADQKIVDNGDGTISITIKDVGRTRVIGPDGRMLFLDSGQFRAVLLVDHNGTPDDPEDDVELGFEPVKEVGHFGTEGRDFCEDLVTYLG